MKPIAAAVALLALAACAVPPEKGALVPIREVFLTHAGQFECLGYDATSDSCEGLGRSEVRGNTITTTTLFAIDIGAPTQITTRSRHTITGNKVCGASAPVDVQVKSAGNAENEALIAEMMKVMAEDTMSGICITYYASGAGYIAEATTLSGERLPDYDTVTRFFPEQKKLRNLSF